MKQNENAQLGSILKQARMKQGYTREQMEERIEVAQRYLMEIENHNKAPNFNVIYRIVRDLNIPSDSVFYPEKEVSSDAMEELYTTLSQFDENEIRFVIQVVKAMREELHGQPSAAQE